jgi:replicative DNA helicase
MTDGWAPAQSVLDAEDQVIGAILAAPVLDDLTLTVGDFHLPANAVVFAAAKALRGRDEPVDPVSVVGELNRTAMLTEAGGAGRVHKLYAGLVTAANVDYHAATVANDARRKRLYEFGMRVVQISGGANEVDDSIAQAREWLAAVEGLAAQATARPVGETLPETLDRLDADAEPGLRTGVADLDEILGPLTPGQLIVVAGRPGAGKSVFLLTLAHNIARALDTGHVALFSLEMGGDEVNHRLLAQTGIPLRSLAPGVLDVDGWARASRALPTLAELPLHVTDSPSVGLADLRRYCRRERGKLRLLIVDYLQLMGTDRGENRQNEVAALSRGLKLLAKSEGIPIVVACQLNRAAEHRQSKRPLLSDLRESGAIEQDADVALLLHREELYDPLKRPGEMDIIVAKQRQGVAGVAVPVGFQGSFSRIVDLAGRWQARSA